MEAQCIKGKSLTSANTIKARNVFTVEIHIDALPTREEGTIVKFCLCPRSARFAFDQSSSAEVS